MATPKELVGRDYGVRINTVLYRCQGTVNANLGLQEADATATGDKVERPRPIRLNGDLTATVISNDEALMALHGSYVTFAEENDGTTTLGPVEALLSVTKAADLNGMVQFTVRARPTELPSQYTALAAL